VQPIRFSKAKYPHIRAHATAAIRDGWPSVLVVNRPGAAARRERVLEDVPTRDGFDRDEYPLAVGRGRAAHRPGTARREPFEGAAPRREGRPAEPRGSGR
jgi:hypothetical protein